MILQALPHIILLGFMHGSAVVATRAGLQAFNVIAFNWLTLAIATVAFIITLVTFKRWPTEKYIWKHSSVWGITGLAIPIILISQAMKHQSSGLTAIIIALAPAITCIIAHYVLPAERLTTQQIIGVSLALAGVIVLALGKETGLPSVIQGTSTGLTLSFIGVTFGASSNVYARKLMPNFDPLQAASIRVFASLAVLAPFFIFGSNLEFEEIAKPYYAPLVYVSLAGTFAGNFVIAYVVKRFGATMVSIAGYIMPTVALVLGVLTLNETVTPTILLGMSFIFFGLALLFRKPTANVV